VAPNNVKTNPAINDKILGRLSSVIFN